MKLDDLRCPYCNALPRGTVEICIATFAGAEPDDSLEWSGDIETDNSQTMYSNEGLPLLICQDGHTYTLPNFTDDALCNLG